MIDNNIVMVLFFLLLFILIVVIVYNYFISGNIEKFENSATTYRIPEADGYISSIKSDNPSFKPESYFNSYNISDTCFSTPKNDKYMVISSFDYVEKPNSASLLVTLNSDNSKSIQLSNTNTRNSYFKKINGQQTDPVVGGNYICIMFPQNKLLLNNLTIDATIPNMTSNLINNFKLFTGNGLLDDSYLQIDTRNTYNNNVIKFVVSDEYNTYINDIIIYFPPEISNITIRKIECIFDTIADVQNDDYNSTRTDVMDTETSLPDPDAVSYTNLDFTNVDNFMKAFYLEVPDFIYDFGSVSSFSSLSSYTLASDGETVTSIQDIFGRQRDNTIISGENPRITYEYDNQNNPYGKYLQGSSRTNILFPLGTIPDSYTICCVTKYQDTGNRGGNTGRIITADNFNFLIGHWGAREGIIYNQDVGGWVKYHENIVTNDPNSKKWLITCVKSAGNGNNNVLINNVRIGGSGGPGRNNSRMAINGNGLYSGEVSDFGIKYIFIWKKALRDDIFQLISDGLNGIVNGGRNYFNLDRTKITMNIKDGLTPSSAASSAREIKSIFGTNKNGFYYIKVPGAGPRLTYCIMDSAVDGGGWMLALQGARYSTRFVYRSPYWTQPYNLNTLEDNSGILKSDPSLRSFVNSVSGDPILDNIIDAKYDVYNNMPCSDCLALFPGSQTAGSTNISGKPQYGWAWISNAAFGRYGSTTLLNFFAKNQRSYKYASVDPNFRRQQADPSDEGDVVPTSTMIATLNTHMPARIWARQTTYFSYGLNITLSKRCWWVDRVNGPYLINNNHQVRWGAVFNENGGDDYSPDVSGGIGLDISSRTFDVHNYTYSPNSSAGNRITCCHDWSLGSPHYSYGMGFQWYIR
jgi:hypothetical protein